MESSTHMINIAALENGVSRAPATWCPRRCWLMTRHSVICVEAARRGEHQRTPKKWKPKHESPIRPIWVFWFSNAGSTNFIIFMLSEMSVWADLRLLTHVYGAWHILYILIKKFGIDQKPAKIDYRHESWIHKENVHYIEKCQFNPQRIRHTIKWGSLTPPYTNLRNIPLFYYQACIINRMLDIFELGHI